METTPDQNRPRTETKSLWALFLERVVNSPVSGFPVMFAGLFALIGLIPVHYLLATEGGLVWSWVAVGINPVAFYLLARGWLRQETGLFFAGVLAALVGNLGPFYLPPI